MIEITHTQARHLIRQAVDRRLPEEQWAVLQAHLEGCAECRAYQKRMATAERDLRRALRQRWNAVNLRPGGLGKAVVQRRERQEKQRATRLRAARYAGSVLAVIFFLMIYTAYRRLTAPPPTPTPFPIAPGEAITATVRAQAFRGVVAFASAHEGNSEIYLLNAGSSSDEFDLINLTSSSYNETDPVWSPDGEWIGFLSDRDSGGPQAPGGPAGKRDLYVMHVAGSRLTRLTADPGVDYFGPLSWSNDGQWIALRGNRLAVTRPVNGGAAYWLYRVPVEGAAAQPDMQSLAVGEEPDSAISVPYTRGVTGVEFSPEQPLLAYGMPDGSIITYAPERGRFLAANRAETGRQVPGGGFDWGPDGLWLAYLSGSGEESRVRAALQQNPAGRDVSPESQPDLVIESQPSSGAFSAVSWSPNSSLRWVVFLQEDEDLPGCMTMRLRPAPSSEDESSGVGVFRLSDLCVEGGLDRTSWTSDGRWLVLGGYLPGKEKHGLYAVRLPQDLLSFGRILVEPISSLAFNPGDLPLPRPRPEVPPGGEILSLQPQPAAQAAATPAAPRPTAAVPSGDSSRLAFTTNGQAGRKVSIAALGERGVPVVPYAIVHEDSCPAWDPGGSHLAYLSNGNSEHGANEVWVTGSDADPRPHTLTQPLFAVEDDPVTGVRPRYRCPVWSPDGKMLAAVIDARHQSYLALIPLDTGTDQRKPVYIPVEDPSQLAGPLWTPDGLRVLLVSTQRENRPVRIISHDVEMAFRESVFQIVPVETETGSETGGQGAGQSVSKVVLFLSGWDELHGWAYNPSGERLAVIVVNYNEDGSLTSQIRFLNADSMGTLVSTGLESYDPRGIGRPNPVFWTQEGEIGFVYYNGLGQRTKSGLMLFDPDNQQFTLLAAFPDVVFDAALSPGGRYAAVASESGLWLVDARSSPPPAPALLRPEMVEEVDWR